MWHHFGIDQIIQSYQNRYMELEKWSWMDRKWMEECLYMWPPFLLYSSIFAPVESDLHQLEYSVWSKLLLKTLTSSLMSSELRHAFSWWVHTEASYSNCHIISIINIISIYLLQTTAGLHVYWRHKFHNMFLSITLAFT